MDAETMATECKIDTVSIIAAPHEGTYVYVAVKGSLHGADCAVFGLNRDERQALSKRFPGGGLDVINGSLVKGQVLGVINSLAELGYRIVSSTGEAEITWTLQREI